MPAARRDDDTQRRRFRVNKHEDALPVELAFKEQVIAGLKNLHPRPARQLAALKPALDLHAPPGPKKALGVQTMGLCCSGRDQDSQHRKEQRQRLQRC
jgi:hypothetical protein